MGSKARQLSLWLPRLLVVGLVQHGLHEVLARRRRGVLPGVLKVSSMLIGTLENLDLSYFVCRKNAYLLALAFRELTYLGDLRFFRQLSDLKQRFLIASNPSSFGSAFGFG